MNDTFHIIFGILMAMVFIWFILLKSIFIRLERQHPEKYKQMGSPSLFWNNSMKTQFSTFKFICKREHKDLNNPGLSKLSDFTLVFFVVYLFLFFGLFLGA
jgi:hypothetical protein